MSTVPQPCDELAERRRLRTWRRAAEYLNAQGYPPIVPPELVAPLRRAGLAVRARQEESA